jgi:iron-sulfur cluster repair protein YtfE (RIC family)
MPATRGATNPLVQELERVHDTLRRDLRTCQDLADAVRTGAGAADLRTAVGQLTARSPHLRLGVDCLRYCRFVHAHHGAEDASLFPVVRRSAPPLGTVVDRLEADHRVVSDLLDAVEAAAHQLDGQDPADARTRLTRALATLSRHLVEHLEVEERVLRPVLMSWEQWPDV